MWKESKPTATPFKMRDMTVKLSSLSYQGVTDVRQTICVYIFATRQLRNMQFYSVWWKTRSAECGVRSPGVRSTGVRSAECRSAESRSPGVPECKIVGLQNIS